MNICPNCKLPIYIGQPTVSMDANIGACAAGAGNFKQYHSACVEIPTFHGPHFGPSKDEIRVRAIEEAAVVLDRIVAEMAAHTNQDGVVTGEDFHHPEIDYLREAARQVRALKQST